jgi:hypothetical protein
VFVSRRVLAQVLLAGGIAALLVIPTAAKAESCVPIPGSVTGVTIEAAGEEIRVPAVSSMAVCYELAGVPGIPWVETEPGGGASVLITGSSGNDGYVVFRYATDGSPSQVGVPIPGTGGGAEQCLVGVGAPARSDCEVKVSIDEIPTLPPVSPPPTPTLPPTPTVPPRPTPTAPPTPEVDPEPACIVRAAPCLPQGGTYWGAVQDFLRGIGDTVREIIDNPPDLFCNDAYCIAEVERICIGKPGSPIICIPD